MEFFCRDFRLGRDRADDRLFWGADNFRGGENRHNRIRKELFVFFGSRLRSGVDRG